MKVRINQYLLLIASAVIVSGCAMTKYNLTIRDQSQSIVDQRIVTRKELSILIDEQYNLFSEGKWQKCRALYTIIATIWSDQSAEVSESRRLCAWSTLFMYGEGGSRLTSLENENRDLAVLEEALTEFSGVRGVWGEEVKVVTEIIMARLVNKTAFDTFIISMKASRIEMSIDGGRHERQKAISAVSRSYPDWCRLVGLSRLTKYTWQR